MYKLSLTPRAVLVALVFASLTGCSDGVVAPQAERPVATQQSIVLAAVGSSNAIDLRLLFSTDFVSHAYALNDKGEVVGRSWYGTFPGVEFGRAFLWKPDGPNAVTGQMTALAMPFGIPTQSEAIDINDKGIAVGWTSGQFGPGPRAALWIDGMGSFLPGDRAVAINNRGDVVIQTGVAVTLWTPDAVGSRTGSTIPLGTFVAHGINDRREVVGSSSGTVHAVVWRPDAPGATSGTLSDLGVLSGSPTIALDINNQGEIVGYGETSSGFPRAFLWRPSVPHATAGATIDLNPLLGAISAIASAINDEGEASGWGGFPQSTDVWVWRPDSKPGSTGTVTFRASVGFPYPDVGPLAKLGPDINNHGDVAFGLHGHAELWRR